MRHVLYRLITLTALAFHVHVRLELIVKTAIVKQRMNVLAMPTINSSLNPVTLSLMVALTVSAPEHDLNVSNAMIAMYKVNGHLGQFGQHAAHHVSVGIHIQCIVAIVFVNQNNHFTASGNNMMEMWNVLASTQNPKCVI